MKQCAQGSFHEARGKHAKKIKMVAQQEERLSEAVRKMPVLYHKADKYYKEDVAKEANLENEKFHSTPKTYFKALSSLLNTNQTTQFYPVKQTRL